MGWLESSSSQVSVEKTDANLGHHRSRRLGHPAPVRSTSTRATGLYRRVPSEKYPSCSRAGDLLPRAGACESGCSCSGRNDFVFCDDCSTGGLAPTRLLHDEQRGCIKRGCHSCWNSLQE